MRHINFEEIKVGDVILCTYLGINVWIIKCTEMEDTHLIGMTLTYSFQGERIEVTPSYEWHPSSFMNLNNTWFYLLKRP